MYNKVLFLSFLWLLIACKQKETPQPIKVVKGISNQLADSRKKQISEVIYHLDFSIPKDKITPITSKAIINCKLTTTKIPLIFDFNEDVSKIKQVIVNSKKINIQHKEEHLIIPSRFLKKAKNKIEIDFEAGELSLNRNKEFLYTLLVPDRASTLFPCFDQPNIKANYQLTITAPKDWKVMCGAFEKSKIKKGDFITHKFGLSDKMSTYLFSFVAGKFSEEIRNTEARTMQFLYRENKEEKIKESLNPIFKIHQQSVSFLEKYTNYSFPFQKLDFVSIPSFQYGGMEHIGAIQYRESLLFLDKNATQKQKLKRAKLIAHETSHMWFGDLVTMCWFNDVWMKEVFANFMADKIMNPVFPTINHNLQFMMLHYPRAYSEDRTKGANPIRQPLDNLKNAGSLYGSIIYNKAPIVMRQLEKIVGEKAFTSGVQEYIKTYANANADWNDLISILDTKTTVNLSNWSDTWINNAGRPIFSSEITYEDEKIKTFNLYQKAEDNSTKTWAQSFSIGLVYKNKVEEFIVDIATAQKEITELMGLPKPEAIIYNYNGFGYGVFPISKKLHLCKNIKNEVARGYTFINLYENMLNKKVNPQKVYTTFLEALVFEENELIASYLSGKIKTIFWSFLTKESQNSVYSKTEAILKNLLKKPANKGLKRSYFSLYKSLAFSSEAKNTLYAIWNKELSIPNLKLNEEDYTNLAMQLALFNAKKANKILELQEKNIKNKDRLARFTWLLPALSTNVKVRDDFMKSLAKKENREKESWVQTALAYVHHPLRHKTSTKHLKMCLDLLEEVQLTGDIFFPKGWLSNSVGNYSSNEAYTMVQEYLAANKKLKPTLKAKLLQASDNLYRAQSIKK